MAHAAYARGQQLASTLVATARSDGNGEAMERVLVSGRLSTGRFNEHAASVVDGVVDATRALMASQPQRTRSRSADAAAAPTRTLRALCVAAVEWGQHELLELLLAGGVGSRSLPLPDAALLNELLGIAARSSECIAVVDTLLAHGADVNSGYQAARSSALHFAAKRALAPLAETLLRAGADVNARTARGETPLVVACDPTRIAGVCRLTKPGDRMRVVELLLHHGADVSIAAFDGYTALHGAATSLLGDAVPILLRYGADASATDTIYAATPMHLVCSSHDPDWHALELLVAHGADPFVANFRSFSSVDFLRATNVHRSRTYWLEGETRARVRRWETAFGREHGSETTLHIPPLGTEMMVAIHKRRRAAMAAAGLDTA